MKRLLWLIVPLALIFVFSLAIAGAQAASNPTTKREIFLTPAAGFPDVKAKSRFEDRGGERRFRVEVEKAVALTGQTLDIRVNGSSIGTALVDPFGNARLALNSDLGATVPIIISGDTVEVRTALGALVASGIF